MKLDEKVIKWIIREKEKRTATRTIAEIEGISTRRVNQIYRQYKETGEIPKLRKPGRPKKELSKEEIKAIKEAYEEYRCDAIVFDNATAENALKVLKEAIIMVNRNLY